MTLQVTVIGFGLSEDEALEILREYNQRCQPPWTEAELVLWRETYHPGASAPLSGARPGVGSAVSSLTPRSSALAGPASARE